MAVARRAAGLGLTAALLGLLVIPWRPPTLCLLRGLTGVPCPFCGGTTAMVELGRGNPLDALRASPLVVLGAPLWTAWPRLGPAVAARLPRRALLVALGMGLAGSQLWQLQRYLG